MKSLKRRKSVDYDAFLLLCSSVMKACMHLLAVNIRSEFATLVATDRKAIWMQNVIRC